MAGFYVSIKDVAERELQFLGYRKVRENAEFTIYEDLDGDEHIVCRAEPFMFVKDVNDVLALRSGTIITAPDR